MAKLYINYMTLIIVLLLLFSYMLIGTSHITNVNKAAIAMFVGAVSWVLYICFGTDFVMAQHPHEFLEYLAINEAIGGDVKDFIYNNIFLNYVGKAASIVLFLLATMTIVEILNNNGCFDFVTDWVRTRSSKRFIWIMTIVTFVVSANLDNLTTTAMMLVIMHNIVQNRKQRMLIGCAIVLAANTGGCFTVIGEPTGVAMWGDGLVTATNFSAYLALPAIIAFAVPTFLIGRELPERLDVAWSVSTFRGDDTYLSRFQRIFMFIIGIGGLWFIPTFHSLTNLSPFLGALCVLAVLWVVHEIFSRRQMDADLMVAQKRMPLSIQYGSIQQILFVMGIMLGLGVVKETGVFNEVSKWLDYNIHNVWVLGAINALASSVVDSFTVAMTNLSMYNIVEGFHLDLWVDSEYMANFVQNGAYWKILAFSTAVGGCLLGFANPSGIALMKMEHIKVSWYIKNCTLKVLAGWLAGFFILWAEIYFFGI